MIGVMVTHTGGPALARHLLRTDENEAVVVHMHGLCATDLHRAISELRLMGRDARTQMPLVHVSASPAIHYDDGQWQDYWDRFETEFDLTGQPYIEAQHLKTGKGGRIVWHRHRAYLRISPTGRVLPMGNTVPRLEKLSRISEFMCGEPFVSGVYNKSVITHLALEGYGAVADAMIAQGLADHCAGSACSPSERAASDRTGDIPADEVKRRIFAVLSSSGSGQDLVAAFAGVGLRLAMGDKAIVAVTPMGNAIPLLRGYNQIARQRGGARLKKAELTARLVGVILAPLKGVVAEGSHHQDWFSHVGAERREKRDVEPAIIENHIVDDPVIPKTVRTIYYDHEIEPGHEPDRSLASRHDAVWEPAVEPIDLANLTPAQQEALDAWLDTMFAPAPSRQDREDDEPEAENQRLRQKKERIDRNRLVAENRHLDQPGLEHPDWRSQYKARLAGIPPDLGSRIAWVDSLEKNRKRIRLRNSTTVITTEPGRISTSEDTLETTTIITKIAAGKGWKEATITGGSKEWREALARESTRAGIAILNPDLARVVADEKQRMEIEKHLADWRDARKRYAQSRMIEDARLVFAAIENMPSDILDRIDDERIRDRLASDLAALARYRRRQAHNPPTIPGAMGRA